MPRIGASAVVLLVWLAGAAPAAGQSYDAFDNQSLNGAPDGSEVAFDGASQAVFITPEFDTSGYTVQAGERGEPPFDHTTCLGFNDQKIFGGRTAWVRFVTRVAGHLDYRAETPGYDSVIWIRKGPRVPRGASTFSDTLNIDCSDAVVGNGSQSVAQPMQPNETFHLQVAGVCARGTNPSSSATCPDPNAAPGGSTRMRVIFTPYNRDGDGVADTLDACPDQPGPPENNGCESSAPPPPDRDGDTIADGDDDCPDKFGPARERPRNGCPEDPVGPGDVIENCPQGLRLSGLDFPGVTINNRAYATNDPKVWLSFALPVGATQIHVANDGSGPWVPFPLQRCAEWTLETSGGSTRESRTVYVRFTGPSMAPSAPLTDDIILDRVRPVATDPEIQPARSRAQRKLGLVGRDADSGVARFDLYNPKGRLVQQVRVCGDTTRRCPRDAVRSVTVPRTKVPRRVRVIDGAGNASPLRTFQAASCRKGIRGVVNGKHTCLYVRKSCLPRWSRDYARFGYRCRRGRLVK